MCRLSPALSDRLLATAYSGRAGVGSPPPPRTHPTLAHGSLAGGIPMVTKPKPPGVRAYCATQDPTVPFSRPYSGQRGHLLTSLYSEDRNTHNTRPQPRGDNHSLPSPRACLARILKSLSHKTQRATKARGKIGLRLREFVSSVNRFPWTQSGESAADPQGLPPAVGDQPLEDAEIKPASRRILERWTSPLGRPSRRVSC